MNDERKIFERLAGDIGWRLTLIQQVADQTFIAHFAPNYLPDLDIAFTGSAKDIQTALQYIAF